MATEILSLGYCREEPKEVLRVVYPNYFVDQYKDIRLKGLVPKRKLNEYDLCCGSSYTLKIRDALIPRGLNVIGSIEDLLKRLQEVEQELSDFGESSIGFETGRISPSFQRTSEDIKTAFKEIVEREVGMAYFEGKLDVIEKFVEKHTIPQVLEIAEAIFGWRDSNSKDLKRILESKEF